MIDAFAIVAILNGEADAQRLAAAIEAARAPSPVAVYEATVALVRASIKVVRITEAMATIAAKAFDKFGKGRRPAKLNMRDCFAYAAARAYRAPLLFEGDDFSRTDAKMVKI